MFLTLPLAPIERFTLTIDPLCRAVAARITRPGKPGLYGPLIILIWSRLRLIWSRLRRLAGRVVRLAARIEAGTPPPRPRPRSRSHTPRPKRPPPPLRLPRGHGWLVRLVRLVPGDAACAGSQLQHLLTQPDMAPLLANPRMGRLLRPLCRMLGVTPPAGIAKPRPKVAPTPSAHPAPSVPPAAQPLPRPRRPAPVPQVHPPACGPPPHPA